MIFVVVNMPLKDSSPVSFSVVSQEAFESSCVQISGKQIGMFSF